MIRYFSCLRDLPESLSIVHEVQSCFHEWTKKEFVTEECPEGFVCESELPLGELFKYENYHLLSNYNRLVTPSRLRTPAHRSCLVCCQPLHVAEQRKCLVIICGFFVLCLS